MYPMVKNVAIFPACVNDKSNSSEILDILPEIAPASKKYTICVREKKISNFQILTHFRECILSMDLMINERTVFILGVCQLFLFALEIDVSRFGRVPNRKEKSCFVETL